MSTSETHEFRYVATRNFRRCRSFSARHHDRDMMRDIMTGDTGSTITGKIAGNTAGLGREKPTCQY